MGSTGKVNGQTGGLMDTDRWTMSGHNTTCKDITLHIKKKLSIGEGDMEQKPHYMK